MVLASLVVGVFAILASSLGAYLAASHALINSADDTLQSNATLVADAAAVHIVDINQETGGIGGIPGVTAQLYVSNLGITHPSLPVTAAVKAVAAGTARPFFTDITVNSQVYREYVAFLPSVRVSAGLFSQEDSGALQVVQLLSGVNEQLSHLGLALLLVAIAVLTAAILLGWLVSRTAVGPLNELTATVEDLARTTDLAKRLEPGGADELGRLRRAFNRLLEALETSRGSQQRLVVDASHELRTPLTSLRTNLEIVRRIDELSEADREVLISDVLTQMQELTNLVGDLAELARGDHTEQEAGPLRLDQLVEDAVELAVSHGRSRGVTFSAYVEPTWVTGRTDRLMRAVGNLLDNALKWSPDGASVEVRCVGGEVAVRDHGPGIDPEDLPHIFDRFYRARSARALPGSGLGLAIVAQVAHEDGGSIGAHNAPDGGAVVTLRIPVVPEPAQLPS
jgi:two-component system sensor histidine kinase MprB